MKTTAELLKFYGVEPGKKYIVTGFSGSYFKQYIKISTMEIKNKFYWIF